jgi:hypothetical protein
MCLVKGRKTRPFTFNGFFQSRPIPDIQITFWRNLFEP